MSSKTRSMERKRAQMTAKEATIEVTLKELRESQGSLQRVMQQPVSGRDAFRLMKIGKAVMAELKTVEETRVKLCEQHGGVFDQKEMKHNFPEDTDMAALDKEFLDVLNMPVVIPGEQIRIDALAGMQISAGDLGMLEWLIKE